MNSTILFRSNALLKGKFNRAVTDNSTCEAEPVKPKKIDCDTEPNYIEQSEQSLFNNESFRTIKKSKASKNGYKLISTDENKNGIQVEQLSSKNSLKVKLDTTKLPQIAFGFFDKNLIKPHYFVSVAKDGTITLIFRSKDNIIHSKAFRGSGWIDFSNAITMDKAFITNGTKKISVQDAMIEAGFMNKCWNNIGFGDWCAKRNMPDRPLNIK